MIFWIEKEFKDEYTDSANNDGLRCKYPIGFDEQTKTKVTLFDHLAAYGAGLTGGQVTVVAVGQGHANLLSGLRWKKDII